jgi:histidinol-phosphate aminotransferase
MSVRSRVSLDHIAPYTQGAAKSGFSSKNSGPVIKLSSNEAAFGPSVHAIEAYQQAAAGLHRYGEGSCLVLREALGHLHGLNPDRLVCGAGSDELIELLIRGYAGPGDEVIYSAHGFLMYPIAAQKSGALPVKAAEKHLQTDIEAILSAVTDRTKMVFIANPNNPTGTYLPYSLLSTLRKRLPVHILLVIDGAYAEFPWQDDYRDGRELVDLPDANTVMIRTFSKIYGLAGLRLGWGYFPDAISALLHRLRGPFNVSSPAVLAGVAALADQAHVVRAREHNREWLGHYSKFLEPLGFGFTESVANFVLIDCSAYGANKAEEVNQFLLKENMIIRPVANYGLPNHLRITIGQEHENKEVMRLLEAWALTQQ